MSDLSETRTAIRRTSDHVETAQKRIAEYRDEQARDESDDEE